MNDQTPMQYKSITVSLNELSVKPQGQLMVTLPRRHGAGEPRCERGWRAWL